MLRDMLEFIRPFPGIRLASATSRRTGNGHLFNMRIQDTKYCKYCQQEKPFSEFDGRRKKGSNGKYYIFIRNICRMCRCIEAKKYYKPKPPKPRQLKMKLPIRPIYVSRKIPDRVCVICNAEFTGAKNAMYCSDACRLEYKRRVSREKSRIKRANYTEEDWQKEW